MIMLINELLELIRYSYKNLDLTQNQKEIIRFRLQTILKKSSSQ
jgi:hypothetical protein